MRKLATLTAAAALAVGFGGVANADPYADSVAAHTDVAPLADPCCGNPATARGAPDAAGGNLGDFTGFVSLTTLDDLTLDFDDNLCFEDGTAADDLTVFEYLDAAETFTAAIGLQGGVLSAPVAGISNTGEMLDFSGVAPGAVFNRVEILSTSDGGVSLGADIDAVQCLATLDVLDITKALETSANVTGDDTGSDDDIFIGINAQQHKAFSIEIVNNTGIDFAFAGLTFMDTVPSEFDIDSLTVDNLTGADDAGECTASFDEHTNNSNSGKEQLKPDFISIDAGGLDDGEFCTITVEVETDLKKGGTRPGRGRSPVFTPTECPDGGVILNDGVVVILDATGAVIFSDDDTLALICD
jgi:hypothetical protein